MAELVVLGVVGGKKLIDNHFDRLPNSTFRRDTYHPRRLKNIRRRNRRSAAAVAAEPHSDSGGETDSDPDLDEPQGPPMDRRMETTSVLPAPPLSARDAPQPRQQYVEARTRDVQVRDEPAAHRSVGVEPRGRTAVYYMDEGPSRPRRPVLVTRRSSSYHDPRDKYPRYEAVDERQYVRRPGEGRVSDMLMQARGLDDRQLVVRSRDIDDRQLVVQSRGVDDRQLQRRYRRDDSPDNDQRSQASGQRRRRRDSAPDSSRQKSENPQDVTPEIDDFFSKSAVGILGGALGAAAGAWISHQAQIASGTDKKGPASKTAMTLLGAAVGGLTVNAVVDKWEDGRRETQEKEKNWDEKWGYPDDSADVGKKKGRREKDGGDGGRN